MARFNISMNMTLAKNAKQIAAQNGQTFSSLIRIALEREIDWQNKKAEVIR